MEKKSIDITFTQAHDCKLVAATGAWFKANPQGDIICSFFVDQQKVPETLKLTIDMDTRTAKEYISDEREEIIREVQVSIVMRPDVAKAIGEQLVMSPQLN